MRFVFLWTGDEQRGLQTVMFFFNKSFPGRLREKPAGLKTGDSQTSEAKEFTLSILDCTWKGLINTVPNSFILVYFGWYCNSGPFRI